MDVLTNDFLSPAEMCAEEECARRTDSAGCGKGTIFRENLQGKTQVIKCPTDERELPINVGRLRFPSKNFFRRLPHRVRQFLRFQNLRVAAPAQHPTLDFRQAR